jgi:hypothetical protein
LYIIIVSKQMRTTREEIKLLWTHSRRINVHHVCGQDVSGRCWDGQMVPGNEKKRYNEFQEFKPLEVGVQLGQ